MNFIQKILFVFGIYYLLTGLWPVIHLESFLVVTGAKHDIWLVKTFSLILASIGITCIVSFKNQDQRQLAILALLTSVSLLFADVYYTAAGVILPVYLTDAVIQFVFILLLMRALLNRSRDSNN